MNHIVSRAFLPFVSKNTVSIYTCKFIQVKILSFVHHLGRFFIIQKILNMLGSKGNTLEISNSYI